MGEIKLPTAGRQVYYYPNGGDKHCANNNAEVLPATVVQTFGLPLNLAVTCMNPDAPVVLRYSVQHKSQINHEGQAYWDWPEVK